MQTNTEKLRILINEYICPLPEITSGQLCEVIDCTLKEPKNGSMAKAVKLLQNFYLHDELWNVRRGDNFCALVQQADDSFNPSSKSKLGLRKAVEIVRFIDANRNFL